MKEKIDRFAKGIFSFDHPELFISADSINISVEAGKTYEGSFSVSSSSGKPFKGYVVASDYLITIENASFGGIDNEIRFTFDARYLDIGDSDQGSFTVISEYGEAEIPFYVKCRVPTCHTSIGPASDLFHFTSLAQSNWSEAKTLFKSEEFRKNFGYFNSEYDNICEALLKSGNISLALEQFLIYTRKKKAVRITCDLTSLNFESVSGGETRSIVLKRDTWGYSQLAVNVSGDFIEPERRIIFTDDFVGNEFSLDIFVDHDKLHGGTNYGSISITGIGTDITIPVVCKNSGETMKDRLSKRRRRYLEMKLISNIVDFRLGKLSKSRFYHEEEKTLESLKMFRDEILSDKLLKCYILCVTGKTSQAASMLKILSASLNDMSDREFAFELFLEALLETSSGVGQDAKERLRELYDRTGDGLVFLCCIELDDKKRISRNMRYNSLKSASAGTESPLVLLEACRIINEEPVVMKEFSGFDLRAFWFGVDHDMLSKDAIRFAAYLAIRSKNVQGLQIRALEKAYSQSKLKEVLESLCHHLVMNDRRDRQAYEFLVAGIEEEIPVNGIYEQCLVAAYHSGITGQLPKVLTGYFENGMDIGDEYKAYYYANVLRYRTGGRDRFADNTVREAAAFAKRKMAEGALSEDLAFLYNNVIYEDDLSEEDISGLPEIMFKHRIETTKRDAVSVIVSHKELAKEAEYPLNSGIAYCDIFTNDAVILLADENGNRIIPGKAHPVKMITSPGLMNLCMTHCRENEMVCLYSIENAKLRGAGDVIIDLEKSIINETNLNERFLLECKKELIEYYYDTMEGELMEKLLVSLDLSELARRDRVVMLGFMIQRELYSLAMRNMQLYGFMGVDLRRLSDMAERLIISGDDACQTPIFNYICSYVLFRRNYTQKVAQQVAKTYEGSAESMYRLWKTARDMDVDCTDFEERLIYQILFTQNDMNFVNEVFRHYYGHGTNRRLIRAFLSYYAYKCLVLDKYADPEMLDIMRHELMYDENEVCSLAILKDLSRQRDFSETNRVFIEKKIESLVNKGILMPFFKNFGDSVRVPESIRERHFVEYHTDPSLCVKIHYCVNDNGNGEYKEALMKDMGYGIFVREFMLFYGETLQYYISEERDDEYNITESGELKVEPELTNSEETGYHQLNLIITAQELNDPKTMIKLLDSYVKDDYITKTLFNPIV